MANCVVLFFLFAVEVFPNGLTAVIQTQQTVMAKLGEDISFSCQLLQSRDVQQVTWQKVSAEGQERNIASYNKYFGQTVNNDFQGKVELKDPGLQNCSIVIREVTEQDEGCYRCLFNTYPDGALTGRTCLQLYELHEPILQIRESNSAAETVVSCSAAGRPAPTVKLTVLRQNLSFSNYSTVSVTNINGTFTVTTAAVLSGFHVSGAQVGCAVRLLVGVETEAFITIPEVKSSSTDGDKRFQSHKFIDEKSGSDENVTWIIVFSVVAALCVCVAVVVAVLILKHKNSLLHRDGENIKTPQKTNKDTYECKTPLITQENEQIRKRSPLKNGANGEETGSPSLKARSLFIVKQ